MPQKVLRFAGINRKINEFQGAGACEELINLRPTTTGLEVVKPKKVKRTNANYDVYTHAFGNKNLTIGVEVGNNFDIYVLKEDGGITPVDSFAGDGPDYSIAFIGNQMLFSHNTTLRVYAYKNNEYVKLDAAVPDNLNVTYSVEDAYGYSQEVSLESSNPASNEFKQETQKHWSAALGENSKKDAIYGPILVAFNFELTDGTEFWTNKWIYINPFLYLPHEI